MVPVHEEKIVMHKLLSKHHDVMYKKLSPCALPPAVGWGVPRRIARHRRLNREPMLLRDLHNSSHHTQPHSVIVLTICDSIRFSIEEENFELVSAMLRRGVEKSSTLMTSSEPFINHDVCTITLIQSGELISLILPNNCECGQL